MKEKIIKTISFLLILFIILIILSYIVMPKNNMKEFGMLKASANGILGEKHNSIDILIVGDSESIATFIPAKLWKDYGFTSYICGTTGQALAESIVFTNKAMKNQKPKIVLLESNNIYEKASLSIPIIKLLKVALPVAEYHNRWKSLNKEDFFKKIDYTWTDDFKGYHDSSIIDPADSTNYMKYTDQIEEIPKYNKMYVKILNKMCKKIDAKLIIVSTPSTINWNYERHNGMEEFTKKEGIEFLDLNVAEGLKIDWQKDTRDKGDHLNNFGASKATEYLGNYLKEKNILENHKNDKYYDNWNKMQIKYDKDIKL